MPLGNFNYFIQHGPVPDAKWELFIEHKKEEREKRIQTGGKSFWGRELTPSGALIRFIPISKFAGDEPSPPVVVLEWVEFVHKDLLKRNNDVAEGFGCELFAKILFSGQVEWVLLNLAMYDFELLSSTTA
jgi:hypothetical protein